MLISLVARYRSPTVFEFVNERCYDLSIGGMFIKSSNPANPGTLLKLECIVNNGPQYIRAVARVVWVRRQDKPEGPAGMGVKFIKLEPGSEEIIEKIIDRIISVTTEEEAEGTAPEKDEAQAPQEEPQEEEPQEEEPQEEEPQEEIAQEITEQKELKPDEQDFVETEEPDTVRPRQGLVESAEPDKEENEPRLEAAARGVEPSSIHRENVASLSAAGENKFKFPAWAIVVCLVCALAFIWIMIEFDETKPKSQQPAITDQSSKNIEQLPDEQKKPQDSDKKDKASQSIASSSTNPSQEELAAAPKDEPKSTSDDSQKTAVTPIPSAKEKQQQTHEKKTKYRLEVKSSPTGALVKVYDQIITTPGTFVLDKPQEPFWVTGHKEFHHSTRIKVAPSDFEQDGDYMKELIYLKLKPRKELDTDDTDDKEASDDSEEEKPKEGSSTASSMEGETPSEPIVEPTTKETDKPGAEIETSADEGDTEETPFEKASKCIAQGDNQCVIDALEGKAQNAKEMSLLIETYRSMGDTENSIRHMKRYIEKYPASKRSESYKKIIDNSE